ncbi:phage tail protein [Xenorhabdus entomophaga]|uniref:phage tail protein n=1 Tax=Xenorhabdus entomophaga TaxID=3136257 RepID=UPI0030F3BA20
MQDKSEVIVPTMDDVRKAIKEAIEEHAASRNHPYATLEDRGFVTLSNEVDSDSEITAATSKAVKKAYDLANTANQNALNNNSNLYLEKKQNGADIPNKTEFVKNIGAQPVGSYAVKGDSYTKGESDSKYQLKGNYQPAGNYAIRGEIYTKPESDARYGGKNTAKKSANGWWQCGDTGIIHQWVQGKQQYSEDNQVITFPRKFPNQVLAIYVSTKINNPTNLNLANDWFQVINWDTEKCWVYLQKTEPEFSVVNSTPFIFAVGF